MPVEFGNRGIVEAERMRFSRRPVNNTGLLRMMDWVDGIFTKSLGSILFFFERIIRDHRIKCALLFKKFSGSGMDF